MEKNMVNVSYILYRYIIELFAQYICPKYITVEAQKTCVYSHIK